MPSRVDAGRPQSAVGPRTTDSGCPDEAALQEGKDATARTEPSLDLQVALRYMEERKDDDRAVGAALRRVVNKGTPGQIAAFTSALIDQLRKTGTTR